MRAGFATRATGPTDGRFGAAAGRTTLVRWWMLKQERRGTAPPFFYEIRNLSAVERRQRTQIFNAVAPPIQRCVVQGLAMRCMCEQGHRGAKFEIVG